MNENEKNKAAVSNFLEKYKKHQNLGMDEFVRQEVVFKNDPNGLEFDNIERMRDGLLFERDELKKKNVLESALVKVNLFLKNNHDIDNRSKALFLKYQCLSDLKRLEESLIAVLEAVQLYETCADIYKPRLGLYYQKSIELLMYFDEFDMALIYLDKAEGLCKGDRRAFVNDLEEIISKRAEIYFKLGRVNEALVEIDKAIYLFSDGDPNQYKTYFSLRTRAYFKRELGDIEGAKLDLDLSEIWRNKDNEKYMS
jgi:tetratricopeptide (TPR) repeat protein